MPNNSHILNGVDDPISAEILDYIKETNDSKDKAYLLLLYRINESLSANTLATQHVAQDFEEHIKKFNGHIDEESKLISTVKGAWRALILSIGLINLIMLGFIGYVYSDFRDMKTGLIDIRKEVTQNSTKIDTWHLRQLP